MKYERASAVALTVTTALGLAASPAFADEMFTLATSKAHKLHVAADGGAAWCRPNVSLRMVLEAGSPDAGNPEAQITMMNRLKPAIQAGCNLATAGELTVSGPGAAPGQFSASVAGDWRFASSLVAAPPPATAPLPAPVPSPVAAVLPREHDYSSLLLAYVQRNPALANDDGILKLWASYRNLQLYQQVWNQEFKLRQLLEDTRPNLAATISQNDGDFVTIILATQFAAYDFKTHGFPVALNANQVMVQSQLWAPSVEAPVFVITVPDLNLIKEIPMDTAAAQAFEERRTRYRAVDRNILVAATIRLDKHGFAKDNRGNLVVAGTLASAIILDDMKSRESIFALSAADVDRMRLAELALQEDRRKQHEQEQRDQNIAALTNSPVATRLANWIASGPIDVSMSLADLRDARADSLLGGKPVSVAMLVQMDANGRTSVDTRWPAHLQVTIPEPAAELKSSGWYLLKGELTAPETDGIPVAQLSATAVYACAQAMCADAADATIIVDREIPAATKQH